MVIEGVSQLLSRPFGCRMIGHIEVDEPSSVVREEHQHKEDSKTDSRHCEEIHCNNLSSVILEERLPALAVCPSGFLGHISLDGGF